MSALIARLERVTLAGAMVWLAALFALGLAEILARLFGRSLSFATEYAGYLTALSFTWGLGPALAADAHVRVTVAPARWDWLALPMSLMTAAILALAVALWAVDSALLGARSYFPSRTPLAIPQALMAWGLIMLALSLVRQMAARPWRR